MIAILPQQYCNRRRMLKCLVLALLGIPTSSPRLKARHAAYHSMRNRNSVAELIQYQKLLGRCQLVACIDSTTTTVSSGPSTTGATTVAFPNKHPGGL
eukprot:2983817-Rhodomonas_salina.1